jgi:hypothetical protein
LPKIGTLSRREFKSHILNSNMDANKGSFFSTNFNQISTFNKEKRGNPRMKISMENLSLHKYWFSLFKEKMKNVFLAVYWPFSVWGRLNFDDFFFFVGEN